MKRLITSTEFSLVLYLICRFISYVLYRLNYERTSFVVIIEIFIYLFLCLFFFLMAVSFIASIVQMIQKKVLGYISFGIINGTTLLLTLIFSVYDMFFRQTSGGFDGLFGFIALITIIPIVIFLLIVDWILYRKYRNILI